MKLSLIIIATLVTLVQSSRYGLLRVGSANVEGTSTRNDLALESNHNVRTIFDENSSL